MALKIFEIDPSLQGCQGQIWDRVNGYKYWLSELEKNEGGLARFAEGYKIYGWNRENDGYTFREWLPSAKQVFLIGEFNNWENTCPLKSEGYGRWSVHLPDNPDGTTALPSPSQIKIRVESNDGSWHDRVPAWTKLAWQDHTTNLFNGVFWEPPPLQRHRFKHPRPPKPANLKIYEAHVGMGSCEPKVATYVEFADEVLPRIARLGYNAVQLMAIAEHAHYGCFGYHVTSFFAPASRSGTPEELKYMVDTAHGLGIIVLMDLVHAHASSNSLDGIAMQDGTDHCYTHGGAKGHHSDWDSKIFNVLKYEVLRFLLSNVRWWLDEYKFDGFRFDGITSMLYHSHGIGKGYTGGYHEYFGMDADIDSHIYLMLANHLIHEIVPTAITVGEDVSGMPTLCRPVHEGGFGFDYRLAMAIPDMFIKLLKESTDDGWDMGHIVHTLTNRRYMEKVVAYAESHDQAIVGDKTLAFWLMDAEMYTGMSCFTSPFPSMTVDRGLALHKMIRLLVLGLGGEAYLNFMGNEFGHPEWVDFPRPENGWSHHHCRRRFDLPEDDLLRYKFFQHFDELMQACESRFTWLDSDYQYVSNKDQGDKVIVFERGDLVFVFNFHPCQSFEGYGVGHKWGEPLRCILDTDEGRFGGHHRLDYGHSNSFPSKHGTHNRPHSCQMYLPSRTAQVLVRESLLEGGIKIALSDRFLAGHGIKSIDSVTLHLEVNKDGETELMDFKFRNGSVDLALNFSATFSLSTGADEKQLECKSSIDGMYRIYFPGEYTIEGIGYVRVGNKASSAADDKAVKDAADAVASAAEAKGEAFAAEAPPAAVAEPVMMAKDPEPAPAPAPAPAPKEEPKAPEPEPEKKSKKAGKAAKAAKPYEAEKPVEAPKAPVEEPAPAPAPAPEPHKVEPPTHAPEPKVPDPAPEPQVDGPKRQPMDMARAYSGSHLISVEELDAAEEKVAKTKSAAEEAPDRATGFARAVEGLGEKLTDFAHSYKCFGLQATGADEFTIREWVPNAKAVYLVGDFNAWDRNAAPLVESETMPGVWSGSVSGITKGSKYKLYVEQFEGEPYWTLPAWCYYYVLSPEIKLLDALYWPMEGPAPKPLTTPAPASEKIYECHPGLCGRDGQKNGFAETMKFLLPRLQRNGYTTLLLTSVLECKDLSSLGMKPVSLFAPARDLGTPEELRALVSKAHEMGIRVIMSIPHNGGASCEDGLGGQYFQAGADGFHKITGARMFNYQQKEVCRYLISSLAFWMEVYGMDGFRFTDVTSSLYTDHGMFVPTDAKAFGEYLEDEDKINGAGVQYMMMANETVHEVNANATTIAEEYTLFPGLCESTESGGLGFDIRQYSNAPETFHSNLNSKRDEEWSIAEMVDAITKPKACLPMEKCLGYTEAAENCTKGQRPLRIAMLSWESLHTIAAGGVAPHVTELSGALHNAGHEVHIFTRSSNGTTWQHPIWGVEYHEVAFPTNGDFVREIENMCGAFVGHYLYVEGQVGGFDIVHGHDWLVGPAVSQLAAMGRRTVFTMHSTETGRCGNQMFGGQSARIRSIEGHGCHAAGRVIAVSGVLKEEVCNHYQVDGRKIEVIYNGIHAEPIVNMEWKDDWTGNTKKDKGFDVMAPMFLFVGRLAVQKGPDLLLEAIPMILQCRGDAKFVIVGDGHMKADLESRAHRMGIGHAVSFAGSVKSGTAHLKALFKSCDAVVVPSRNEPFGIVVLEAWAAGKPVVATTCGGPRDFVLSDKDGYLVDPNPGSIAWGCCKICENFDHARWMGQRAQKKALEEFNWSFIARQTETIYYQQMDLFGCPKFRAKGGGAPLAANVLGPHRQNMGVMEDNLLAWRGLAMLKQMKMLVGSLGSDSVLTWMGSEFGQIDSVDLPRGANGFREFTMAYGEADNKGLKFKHLEMFELCLNRTEAVCKWLSAASHKILVKDEEKKVLVYARGGCVFAFNFHPGDAYDGYKVSVPSSLNLEKELCVALNSEDTRFGGSVAFGKAPAKLSSAGLKVELPARCALVLAPASMMASLSADKLLQSETDQIINTTVA